MKKSDEIIAFIFFQLFGWLFVFASFSLGNSLVAWLCALSAIFFFILSVIVQFIGNEEPKK